MPPKTLQIRNSTAKKELDEISDTEDFSVIAADGKDTEPNITTSIP